MSVRTAVITCSDSKAGPSLSSGSAPASHRADALDRHRAEVRAGPGAGDRSGPLAAELLAALGHEVVARTVVPDEVGRIQHAVLEALEAGCRVVVCTGGTGLGPRDVTPEAVEALGGRPLPGIGEAIRAASRERVPTTDLSRAGAVAIGRCLVVLLPGSPGGVRDGLAVAGPLLDHAVAMLDGAGHHQTATGPTVRAHRSAAGVPARTGNGGIPPASAGSHADSPPASVGPEVIDAAALVRAVERPGAGAIVTFEGRVRNHDGGRSVAGLTYEAHPDAGTVLGAVLAEARGRPGVAAAATAHRTGDLVIGDLAFFVAVSAAHRREAFEACAWLVDAAKARTPIWKHQIFADGTSEWVNCP